MRTRRAPMEVGMSAIETEGLYQSGPFLVIDRNKAKFTDHCVMCNSGGTVTTKEMNLRMLRHQGRGAIGVARSIAESKTCKFEFPICQGCGKKIKASSNLFAGVALGVWGVGGVLGVLIATMEDSINKKLMAIIAIASVIFFVVGLICLIIALFKQNAGGRDRAVAHIDEEFIWMRDVHHNWLAALPQWSGPNFKEVRRMRGDPV